MNMKIKKGDTVKVMVGKDRGKEGKVEKLFPHQGRVVLPGLNMYKRHMKRRGEGKQGGIIDISRPFAVANLALICPKCHQVTRAGFKLVNDKKMRICRKCEEEF